MHIVNVFIMIIVVPMRLVSLRLKNCKTYYSFVIKEMSNFEKKIISTKFGWKKKKKSD